MRAASQTKEKPISVFAIGHSEITNVKEIKTLAYKYPVKKSKRKCPSG